MTTRRTVITSGLAAVAAAAVASQSTSADTIDPPTTPKGDFTSAKQLQIHASLLDNYIDHVRNTTGTNELANEIEKAAIRLLALTQIAIERKQGQQVIEEKLLNTDSKMAVAGMSNDDLDPSDWDISKDLWGHRRIPLSDQLCQFLILRMGLMDEHLYYELRRDK